MPTFLSQKQQSLFQKNATSSHEAILKRTEGSHELGHPKYDSTLKSFVGYLIERLTERLFLPPDSEGNRELRERYRGFEPTKLTEFVYRYVQREFARAFRGGFDTEGVCEADCEKWIATASHPQFHVVESNYLRLERIGRVNFFDLLSEHSDLLIEVVTNVAVTLYDLTCARVWFHRAVAVAKETTWELYKRFDPNGVRRMNQGHFYSLMPRSFRELEQYQKIDATYTDCVNAEEWFRTNRPRPEETTWELYKRFDPECVRQMHQGQFYSLIPRSFRELEQYQKIDATYADCVKSEKWFGANPPRPEETTWELYKRFDPDGVRQMNQGHFYSLMPRSFRELEQYQYISASYADCMKAEKWFRANRPLPEETTWELYKRFDPNGVRRMNQGHFYSLMPRSFRELEQYQKINASYADCVKAEAWFRTNRPLPEETTWELYKRFDPEGVRQMHQGHFYSLMPRSFRELDHYQVINATYADCVRAEEWFRTNRPLPEETTWELYKRFDPEGVREMHQGQFYSLIPRSYRELGQYQKIEGTYENCVRAEEWFRTNRPLPEETTWELYKRFDPEGVRQMHQSQFYSLMPRSFRELEQYQKIEGAYADCVRAEEWFRTNRPLPEETTWELYKRFDPEGVRQMHQGNFYSLMPRSFRELEQYQKINATYADCVKAEIEWREIVVRGFDVYRKMRCQNNYRTLCKDFSLEKIDDMAPSALPDGKLLFLLAVNNAGGVFAALKFYHTEKGQEFAFTPECFMGTFETRSRRIDGRFNAYDRRIMRAKTGDIDAAIFGLKRCSSVEKQEVRLLITEQVVAVFGVKEYGYLGLETANFDSLRLLHEHTNIDLGRSRVVEFDSRVYEAMLSMRQGMGDGEKRAFGCLTIEKGDITQKILTCPEKYGVVFLDFWGQMSKGKEETINALFDRKLMAREGLLYLTIGNTPLLKARAAGSGYSAEKADSIVREAALRNGYELRSGTYLPYSGGISSDSSFEMMFFAYHVRL